MDPTAECVAALRALVERRTGIRLSPGQREKMRGVLSRLRGERPAEEYLARLEGAPPGESREWGELLAEITVMESYFFRDGGQFSLLEQRILPELIDNNRHRRRLRLWSAGCAGGEEPYSLAMLLDRLLPDADRWDLLVLGTDVNRAALGIAERGVYGEWSFRATDPALRRRHFTPFGGRWRVREGVRERVRFAYGNLLADDYPDPAGPLHDMDLILCRNVFIYLSSSAVGHIVEKMARTLVPGGYLITGHTELFGRESTLFEQRFHPESLVHRRTGARRAATAPPAVEVPSGVLFAAPRPPSAPPPLSPPVPAAPPSSPPPGGAASLAPWPTEGPLEQAATHYSRGDYAAAAEAAEAVEAGDVRCGEALCLAAKAHANLGRYEEAERCARRALDHDELMAEPYYLLAHLKQMVGEDEEAEALFCRVLYLAPDYIPGYLDLATLHWRRGNAAGAGRCHRGALELLRKTPAETRIEPYELTAGELTERVARQLDTGSERGAEESRTPPHATHRIGGYRHDRA